MPNHLPSDIYSSSSSGCRSRSALTISPSCLNLSSLPKIPGIVMIRVATTSRDMIVNAKIHWNAITLIPSWWTARAWTCQHILNIEFQKHSHLRRGWTARIQWCSLWTRQERATRRQKWPRSPHWLGFVQPNYEHQPWQPRSTELPQRSMLMVPKPPRCALNGV